MSEAAFQADLLSVLRDIAGTLHKLTASPPAPLPAAQAVPAGRSQGAAECVDVSSLKLAPAEGLNEPAPPARSFGAAKPPPARRPKPAHWGRCTHPRKALLLPLYNAGTAMPEIRSRLLAINGPPLPSNELIQATAASLGGRRPKARGA